MLRVVHEHQRVVKVVVTMVMVKTVVVKMVEI